jgi:hypothetical protein
MVHSSDFGEYSIAYNIFGTMNMAASFFVLLTFMIWPETLYQTKKGKFGRLEKELNPFKGIILMITVSVFIYCLSFSFGFPKNAALCEAQGVLVNFATRAIYFWNTCLSYKIYQVMVIQEEGMSFKLMNVVVWNLNVLLAVLPFSTGAEYGIDSAYLGKLMCYFKGGGSAMSLWIWVTFFVPQILCLLIMSGTNLALARRFQYLTELSHSNPKDSRVSVDSQNSERSNDTLAKANTVTKSLKKVVWGFTTFPVVMIMICLPNVITFVVLIFNPYLFDTDVGLGFSQVMFLWTCVYGIVLMILFLYTMKECRRKWATLLFGYTFPKSEDSSSSMGPLDEALSDNDSDYSYSVDENNSGGIGMTRYSESSGDVDNPVHTRNRDESLFSSASEYDYRYSTDSEYRDSERVSQSIYAEV